MNIKLLVVAVLASIVGLFGCKQNNPPADALPMPAKPAAVADVPAVVESKSGATLSVEPGHVFACEGRDRTISTVKWEVTDPSVVGMVQVAVDSATDPERKSFAVGGATGEAVTGNWVGAGVRFHLVEMDTGRELATHVVTSSPCQ